MKTYTTYIFDLDGTITDTAVIWLDIFRECLTHCNITPPDDKTLAAHTHGWPQMLKLGLPEADLPKFIKEACKLADERLQHAPLHDGAYETLEKLKNQGKNLAVFSAMDGVIFHPTIEYRGLDKLIGAAVAGDEVPQRKPHPDGILKALNDLGVKPEDYDKAVYVGDKDTDVQAAHNAGIDSILYFPIAHQLMYSLDEVKKHNPTHIITDWRELLAQD